MKYIDIAHVNKRVSRIVCGTAAAPYNTGADCNELLSGMLALGVNVFDTARVYGGADGNADDAVNALLSGTLRYNPDVQCNHHAHGDHPCGDHGCGTHGCLH